MICCPSELITKMNGVVLVDRNMIFAIAADELGTQVDFESVGIRHCTPTTKLNHALGP